MMGRSVGSKGGFLSLGIVRRVAGGVQDAKCRGAIAMASWRAGVRSIAPWGRVQAGYRRPLHAGDEQLMGNKKTRPKPGF